MGWSTVVGELGPIQTTGWSTNPQLPAVEKGPGWTAGPDAGALIQAISASAISLAPSLITTFNPTLSAVVATAVFGSNSASLSTPLVSPVSPATTSSPPPLAGLGFGAAPVVAVANALGIAPNASVDVSVSAAAVVATAMGLVPSPGVDYVYTVMVAIANATGSVIPQVLVDVLASDPVAASAATALAPTIGWVQNPVLTQYQTANTSGNYPVPTWCNYVDVIAVGGGNGGGGGWAAYVTGGGGNAGAWATATLTRGLNLATTLAWTIPQVPNGGTSGNKSGGGGAVTCTGSGWAGLSAAGGTSDQFGSTRNGASPGNQTFNSRTYTGAAVATGASTNGNAPGGGGAGGNGGAFSGSTGGKGGPGGIWFYAYQ